MTALIKVRPDKCDYPSQPRSNSDPGGCCMTTLEERLERMERMLAVLVEQQTVREWYTTEQAAQLVGKAEFTVRAWCRRGRIQAQKKDSGRGAHASWVISHTELLRYQREGLLRSR